MMRWGRKKSVSTSTSSSSSVSWFSKLSGSSNLKLAKEKKQDDEASKIMSSKTSLSSTKPRNDTRESSGRFQRASVENEKFEEIMRSVKKKVQEFQIETRGYLDGDKGTVIMTPRIRDKVRCERRDQRLLEQKTSKAEQDAKKPTRRITRSHSREDSLLLDNTETKPAPQWQKLKEVKLREVKLKAAEQQRKSLYIKRELNSSKVRVFSPRASEKCRVKAIEDLKKAKLRAREHEHELESESFAVVKCSSDPQKDFRDSMIEMIMENGINHPDELKELLVCYLRLNTDEYHDMIIKVFQQVHNDLKFHYFGTE